MNNKHSNPKQIKETVQLIAMYIKVKKPYYNTEHFPNSQEKAKEAVDILWDTHHSEKLFYKWTFMVDTSGRGWKNDIR